MSLSTMRHLDRWQRDQDEHDITHDEPQCPYAGYRDDWVIALLHDLHCDDHPVPVRSPRTDA
jgi:hypothetical protein